MIAFFQKRSPVNVLLLFLLAVAVKLPLFLHPTVPPLQLQDSDLFCWLVNRIAQLGSIAPWVFSGLSFSLFYSQALLLNYFFHQQKMSSRPTDLPGMSFLLLSSVIPEWNQFTPPLLASTILLYLLFALYRLFNQSNVPRTLFNMGFAVGVGCFLFLPALTIGIWLLIAILIMRPFKLQEILLLILGVATPFYFYGVWIFWHGQWQDLPWLDRLDPHFPGWHSVAWIGGAACIILLPLLVGTYQVQKHARKMLIQVRRGWAVLSYLLLISVLVPFLDKGSFTGGVLALIPLASFHACFYLYTRFRIIPLLFFWLSFFFVLITQFSGSAG